MMTGVVPNSLLIAAATSSPAEAFRWRNVGHIKVGYDADALVVDADPTADIRNLKKMRLVIHNGQIIDRDALLNSR